MVRTETDSTLAEELYFPLARGEDLTPELLSRIPDPYYVVPPRNGAMPEMFGFNLGIWTVKENVKQIIEELEPGVHTFIPVNLRARDSGKNHGRYYLLHFGQAINAVVIEETDFAEGHGREAYVKSSTLSSFGDCVLDARLVAGKHLWRGARGRYGASVPFSGDWFCSDELATRLKAIGAEGWRYQSCKLKT